MTTDLVCRYAAPALQQQRTNMHSGFLSAGHCAEPWELISAPNEMDTNSPYFTNEESETRRGPVTCFSHMASKRQSWDLNLGSVLQNPVLLHQAPKNSYRVTGWGGAAESAPRQTSQGYEKPQGGHGPRERAVFGAHCSPGWDIPSPHSPHTSRHS